MGGEDRPAHSVLTAFYDLSVSPTGFDSVVFLALAELARLRRGCDVFHVVFVPASGGFWANESYDTGYKAWRLHHLLLPLATLFPTCRGITLCATRDEAAALCRKAGKHVFPEGYSAAAPPAEAYQLAHFVAAMTNGDRWTGWQPPAAATAFIDQWLAPRAGGRKVVTITLREARYNTAHNSNRQAWAEFARGLDRTKYFPVFLRDTEAVLDPPPEELHDCTVFGEPSFNVALRAALYLKAHLNLLTSGGPMCLAWLHPDCATLVFRLLDPSDYRATPAVLAASGFEPGRQPRFLSPRHRIVWSGDDLESIKTAFAEREEPSSPERTSAGKEVVGDTAFDVARRLRLGARLGAAHRIYAHLLETSEHAVSAAAARAGLALIALNASGRSGRLRHSLTLLRLKSPDLRRAARLAAAAGHIDTGALLDLVDWCLRFGRLDRARSFCAMALAAQPESAEAQRLAGEIDLRLGRTREALAHLDRATALRPWSAVTRYGRGVALLLEGREDEAKADFLAAARDDPSHEAARLCLASLAPDVTLDPDFTYEAALARRGGIAAGTVGELDYVVPLAELRRGYRVIYFRRLFHAVPDRGGVPIAIDWRRGKPYRRIARLGPLSPLLLRLGSAAFKASRFGAAFDRLGDILLYRREEAEDALVAPRLAELDRLIAAHCH